MVPFKSLGMAYKVLICIEIQYRPYAKLFIVNSKLTLKQLSAEVTKNIVLISMRINDYDTVNEMLVRNLRSFL